MCSSPAAPASSDPTSSTRCWRTEPACAWSTTSRPTRAAGLPRPCGGPRRRRPVRPGVADAQWPAWTSCANQAAKVGLGVDFGDVGWVRDRQRPGHCPSARSALATVVHRPARPGPASMVVYGEGTVPLPRPRRRASGVRNRGRPGRRDNTTRRAGERLRRAGRVATIARRRQSSRNVYAATKLHQEHLCALWARRPAQPLSPSATKTSTGRGCPATRRTPAWPPSSAAQWPPAGLPRSTRTADRRGTSCT